MKDFLELCGARYSLRTFAERDVEKEKIERCLEAARLAPSASNGQPWRFIVFDDPVRKRELGKAAFTGVYKATERLGRAPVMVVLLAKRRFVTDVIGRTVQGTAWHLVDCGIAGEHFALAAAEQGLGTCWIGWFEPRGLTKFLGLKGKGYVPVALFAVGYPPEGHPVPVKNRKSREEIAGWNRVP